MKSPSLPRVPYLSVLALAALATNASALTFVSGFNGDLVSTIGPTGAWEVPGDSGMPAPVFVPSLTEGTQAVQVANDPVDGSWPAFLLINGSFDLANTILSNRTLVFEAAASPDMISRELLAVLNSDFGWTQTADGQHLLTPPVEGHLYDRVVIDMTDPVLGWRTHAESWIAGAAHDYFELGLILLGSDLSGNLPLTTIDNVRFLAADFKPDENGDFILEGEVNAADLAVWISGFGLDATGDADNDGVTSGFDFLTWQQEAKVTPALVAAGVPEPAGIVLLAMSLAGVGLASLRR